MLMIIVELITITLSFICIRTTRKFEFISDQNKFKCQMKSMVYLFGFGVICCTIGIISSKINRFHVSVSVIYTITLTMIGLLRGYTGTYLVNIFSPWIVFVIIPTTFIGLYVVNHLIRVHTFHGFIHRSQTMFC